MRKSNTRRDIKEATAALKEVMQENLSMIASNMIEQIITNYRNLIPSQRLNATKNVSPTGIKDYKEALLLSYAIIAGEALTSVRKEVPSKKNVRLAEIDENSLQLGEFESLPPDLQKRLKSMMDLFVGTQISDLEKAIYFQYNSSVDSTDSEGLLRDDLTESASDYISSSSIQGGASAASAQIVNESRLAFFLDDSVSEDIEAFEFVNGDPVSPICQDLAGTIFAKDDPNLHRYWPPLHFNCKSYISAILVGNLGNKEVTSFKPSNAKLEDSIQFAEITIDLALKESKTPRP